MLGSIAHFPYAADVKVYSDITDQDKMLHVVGEYLSDMNAGSKKPQNLVLFQFALEHVARISRIITSPGAQPMRLCLRDHCSRLAAHDATRKNGIVTDGQSRCDDNCCSCKNGGCIQLCPVLPFCVHQGTWLRILATLM